MIVHGRATRESCTLTCNQALPVAYTTRNFHGTMLRCGLSFLYSLFANSERPIYQTNCWRHRSHRHKPFGSSPLSRPSKLENRVRIKLTKSGFAIRRLIDWLPIHKILGRQGLQLFPRLGDSTVHRAFTWRFALPSLSTAFVMRG